MDIDTANPHEWIARQSDRIANLIFHTDYQWIDIEIQIAQLREQCLDLFPDKAELFEHLYVSRFRRLWEQWHEEKI